jgi:hypothetical protein
MAHIFHRTREVVAIVQHGLLKFEQQQLHFEIIPAVLCIWVKTTMEDLA